MDFDPICLILYTRRIFRFMEILNIRAMVVERAHFRSTSYLHVRTVIVCVIAS